MRCAFKWTIILQIATNVSIKVFSTHSRVRNFKDDMQMIKMPIHQFHSRFFISRISIEMHWNILRNYLCIYGKYFRCQYQYPCCSRALFKWYKSIEEYNVIIVDFYVWISSNLISLPCSDPQKVRSTHSNFSLQFRWMCWLKKSEW